MREYKYKNINFLIDFIREEDEEEGAKGSCSYIITMPYNEEHLGIIEEFIIDYREDINIDYNGLTMSFDLSFFTDLFLIITHYALSEIIKDTVIEYRGMPFWFAHDLSHLEKDTHYGFVSVNAAKEFRAFKDSFTIKKRKVFKNLGFFKPSNTYLYELYLEFKERFPGSTYTSELFRLFKLDNLMYEYYEE